MDFSEFETARGGIWRICAVIDHATKFCLAATVTVLQIWSALTSVTCGGPDRLRRLSAARLINLVSRRTESRSSATIRMLGRRAT
jgi:hypothetical protein